MSEENNSYKNISLKEFIFEKYVRKIFSIFFISNNINIDDVNVNEISKRQNFINNLSLFEWFDLYGKYTLKTIHKKILTIIIRLFMLFIVINIVLFSSVIINELKDKQYPKQKAILISSHTITRIYILPIGKHLGFQTPILIPFRFVRDCLYNKGISMLPEDSSEREVWWYNTRFLEYAAIVKPTISKWFSSHKKPFSDKEINNINDWNNEVYNHILIFPETDFTSTKYENYQIQIYRDMIDAFRFSMTYFSITQQIVTPYWLKQREKQNRGKFPGPKYEAVKYNLEFLEKFDQLKEQVKKEFPNAYKEYEKEPIIEEYILKKDLVDDYLKFKETFDKIDCNSEEFLIFADMRSKMINYMIKNGDSIAPRYFLRYQFALMTSIDTSVCPLYKKKYNDEFEKLSEYIQKRNEEFNKRQQKKKRK